jgi:peptidylprolyl isomerase
MIHCRPFLLALLVAAPLPAAAATSAPHATHPPQTTRAAAKTVRLPDGLQYVELKVGQGAKPRVGQTVVVQYTGTFTNGKKFDSSRDRNQPYEFTLGQHGVIACWDEAVATMRAGGRRKLICPPALAYGPRGYPPVIPPNATLVFDVELLGVR